MHPVIASRQHTIKRVFVADSPATDAMAIGHLAIQLKDGSSVEADFIARFVMRAEGDGKEKLEFVQIWSVCLRQKIFFLNQS
jgi:hypothetical protein